MLIFFAYEGFELIANTARDVRDPNRTLPRAYYSAVLFVMVLYVSVSVVTVGNLDVPAIVQAKDNALAVAARPFMGHAGFVLIAVAACTAALAALVWRRAAADLASLWVLATIIGLSLAIEGGYRLLTGRQIRAHLPRP